VKFAVGTDHAGFQSREKIIEYLEDEGHTVIDVGTFSDESCDYPHFGHRVAQEISADQGTAGILVCGSGEGMVMTANRYPGVRAALCLNPSMAEGTRAHNDANCLVMAERVMDEKDVLPTLEAFMDGDFDGGRHERRIRKIDRPPLRVVSHPIVQTELANLRDADTDHADFAESLERVTKLLFYELSSSFPASEGTVEAPMGEAPAKVIERDIVLVPVIRAGLGMLEPVRELLPESYVAHVGFSRDEESLEPHEYYRNIPHDLDDPLTVLLDPMLATGGTATNTVNLLKEEGLDQDIRFLNLVTAPEGLTTLHEEHPDVAVYTAALDDGLNDDGYIVPGLGDAGDRLFGTV
jgi:uracil phosphoribosyltransferase